MRQGSAGRVSGGFGVCDQALDLAPPEDGPPVKQGGEMASENQDPLSQEVGDGSVLGHGIA